MEIEKNNRSLLIESERRNQSVGSPSGHGNKASKSPAHTRTRSSSLSPSAQRVAEVIDSWWHSMLILPPLLKDSPASPFLAAYYPDCVGMSPSSCPGSGAELRGQHCRTAQPQSEHRSWGGDN